MSTGNQTFDWPQSYVGTVYSPSPCIQRLCGGSYPTGGVWGPIEIICIPRINGSISRLVSELEDLLNDTINNPEVCARMSSDIYQITLLPVLQHTDCYYPFAKYRCIARN